MTGKPPGLTFDPVMERFFHPRSIVLFGASSNPVKGGNQVLQNFKQYMEQRAEDGLPPGVNSMREFQIVVRKSS